MRIQTLTKMCGLTVSQLTQKQHPFSIYNYSYQSLLNISEKKFKLIANADKIKKRLMA